MIDIKRLMKCELFQERCLKSVIVAFIAVAFASAWFREFNHDEFEALHASWLVFSGKTIYVDFLQHHHFFLYYALVPVFGLFGESTVSIMAARTIMFVAALGIGFFSYRIADLQYGKRVALRAIFFLATTVTFLNKAIEIRPDVPLVLFGLVATYFFLLYETSRNKTHLITSAIALFLAFLFLQKAVFYGILLGILSLRLVKIGKMPVKDFFVYWGVFSVLLGGFVWYVSVTFTWSEYFFLNWLVNTKLLNTFPLYKYLLSSFGQNPLLWVAYASGMMVLFQKRKIDSVAVLSVGLLCFIFLTKSPFPQYYLMSLPFISMVAAKQYFDFSLKKPTFAFGLCIVSVVWASGWFAFAWDNNAKQLAKVKYVLSMTTSEDFVYDGDAQFNVFRYDIDYFWFSVKPKTGVLESYRLMRPYDYDPYRLITEKKPKVISGSFIREKDDRIADQYEQSPIFDDLFIRK